MGRKKVVKGGVINWVDSKQQSHNKSNSDPRGILKQPSIQSASQNSDYTFDENQTLKGEDRNDKPIILPKIISNNFQVSISTKYYENIINGNIDLFKLLFNEYINSNKIENIKLYLSLIPEDNYDHILKLIEYIISEESKYYTVMTVLNEFQPTSSIDTDTKINTFKLLVDKYLETQQEKEKNNLKAFLNGPKHMPKTSQNKKEYIEYIQSVIETNDRKYMEIILSLLMKLNFQQLIDLKTYIETTFETKTKFIEKVIQNIDGSIAAKTGGKRKPLTTCTVAELKAKAKKRGIKVTGLKKAEIIAKLRRR